MQLIPHTRRVRVSVRVYMTAGGGTSSRFGANSSVDGRRRRCYVSNDLLVYVKPTQWSLECFIK